VRLVLGKRPTSPTVPKIVAARMRPTPKISVRVLPEVSTSFHLGFDARVQVSDLPLQRPEVAQYLGGQAPAQALRGAAPGPQPLGTSC
jgi:hypothetical protein